MSGENKPRPEVPGENMEQRLSDWIEELHRRAPESIGDLLRFRVTGSHLEMQQIADALRRQSVKLRDPVGKPLPNLL